MRGFANRDASQTVCQPWGKNRCSADDAAGLSGHVLLDRIPSWLLLNRKRRCLNHWPRYCLRSAEHGLRLVTLFVELGLFVGLMVGVGWASEHGAPLTKMVMQFLEVPSISCWFRSRRQIICCDCQGSIQKNIEMRCSSMADLCATALTRTSQIERIYSAHFVHCFPHQSTIWMR